MPEQIDEAQVIEAEGQWLPVRQGQVGRAEVTLYGTTDPAAIVAAATQQATALADVIEAKHLYAVMGKDKDGRERRHVLYEGWALCGTLLGVYAVVEDVRPLPDHEGAWQAPLIKEEWVSTEGGRRKQTTVVRPGRGGWEARAEARTRDGAVVGADVAVCTWDEPRWESRTSAEVLGMAQTRAKSRALRGPLGFIVALAGYVATPAEEMRDAVAALPINVGDGQLVDFGPYLARAALDPDGQTLGALKRYALDVAGDKAKAAEVYAAALAEAVGDVAPDEFDQADLLARVGQRIKGAADAS